MKILDLTACNFLTIGNEEQLLSLDSRGLLAIAGQNKDDPSAGSNGAGKSTVPDALCWVLNDETARGESGDAVVNDQSKKNCYVSTRLLDGDILYRVSRYRKHTKFKNSAIIEMWPSMAAFDAKAEPTRMDKGTERETQEVIQRILGCSPQVFMASIYAGQEKMPDLPKMTDKELKMLIEEAAGVERLEKAFSIAKEEALKANNDMAIHDATVEREKINNANIKAQIANAQASFNNYEAARPGLKSGYVSAVAALKVKAATPAAFIKSVDEAALNKELTEVGPQLASGDQMNRRKTELERAVAAAKQNQALGEAAVRQAKTLVTGIEAQIVSAEAQMAKPCPECGKPHTIEDLDQYKAAASERLQAAKEKVAQVEPLLGVHATAVQQAQDALQAFVATIPDLSVVAARYAAINATLRQYVEAKNQIALILKEVQSNVALAETVMTAINPHQATIDAYTKQLTESESKLSKFAAQRSVIEAEQVLANNVLAVFSPSGVRAHILDTITPFLNHRTAFYLNALSDGNISAVWSTLTTTAKGELREKFNIEVESATGGKSFGLLSGGEKRKVRVSTMLALQDLVATRATKSIDLWIGDEIDHALDAPGLERLMGILEVKARERGTVLIISHNELGDWVDQVVTVVKEGRASRLEGAVK